MDKTITFTADSLKKGTEEKEKFDKVIDKTFDTVTIYGLENENEVWKKICDHLLTATGKPVSEKNGKFEKMPRTEFVAFLLYKCIEFKISITDVIDKSKLKQPDYFPPIGENGLPIPGKTGNYFNWDENSNDIEPDPSKLFFLNDNSGKGAIKNLLEFFTGNDIYKNKLKGIEFTFVIKEKNIEEKTGENIHMEKNIKDIIKNGIENNKQVIFNGAPGTGKTFMVRNVVRAKIIYAHKGKFALPGDLEDDILEKLLHNVEIKEENGDGSILDDHYKFVQFHPSYDYSDFVEGLRPVRVRVENGGVETTTFVRLDGIFKGFCRKIVDNEIESYYDKNEKESNENQQWSDLPDENKKKYAGKWKELKREDRTNEAPEYYFIIDEINRADLSKVFGELMFGLEESYRGPENKFVTQYKNLKTYYIDDESGFAKPKGFDCFEDGFFIPDNLAIIGTMNDIDRSVESFDFALRRRFQWINIEANVIMKESLKDILHGSDNDDFLEKLVEGMKNMNKKISGDSSFRLSEAYHIGPAYCSRLVSNDHSGVETTFKERIEPLLREYTRGYAKEKVDNFITECSSALLTPFDPPKETSAGSPES